MKRVRKLRMKSPGLWALLTLSMFLVACAGQTPTEDAAPMSVPSTVDPTTSAAEPTHNTLTPSPQGTTEPTAANETPTPASLVEPATPTVTEETTAVELTSTPRPAITLVITVAAIPTDIPVYSRSQWKHWIDEDGDCQDARQEVLIQESLVEVTFESEKKCRVAAGRWYGAFTGAYIEDPGELDIDHLVPLKNAHTSGGWTWESDRKQAYANDLNEADHLIAVTKGANRSKGAKGPDEWRPPDEGYWCKYATDWTEVKMEWGLTMTQSETEAVIEMLDSCEKPVEVEAESTFENDTPRQSAAEGATATPTVEPEPEPQDSASVYDSCEEAEGAGESRVQGSVGGGEGSPRKWCQVLVMAMEMG